MDAIWVRADVGVVRWGGFVERVDFFAEPGNRRSVGWVLEMDVWSGYITGVRRIYKMG